MRLNLGTTEPQNWSYEADSAVLRFYGSVGLLSPWRSRRLGDWAERYMEETTNEILTYYG